MLTDEFKKTEKWLYKYKELAPAIRQYELQIQAVRNDIAGCGGISYDSDKLSESFNINNQVENEVIAREKKIEELESKKKSLEIHKTRLEIAINNFNSEQYTLFELVYINKKNWTRKRILREMGISKDTYYRIKRELVYSAINSMNPERTLKYIQDMFLYRENQK